MYLWTSFKQKEKTHPQNILILNSTFLNDETCDKLVFKKGICDKSFFI